MSHFFVIALVPEDQLSESKIDEMMNPYYEGLIVTEYQDDCYCRKARANKKGTEKAEKEFGKTWKELHEEHNTWEEKNKPSKEEFKEKYGDWFDKTEKQWQKMNAPLVKLEEKYQKELFATEKPDPECEECHGKGTYPSTYNPLSKWDWWSYGGRWNGVINGNPVNDKEGGFNFGEEFRQLKNNTTTVADLIERKQIPFAIITPDGQWNERGKMGWWACVSDEKESDDWENMVLKIYEAHKDCIGVGLDCHI